MEEVDLAGRIDHDQPVWLGDLRGDLGEMLGSGHASGDREAELALPAPRMPGSAIHRMRAASSRPHRDPAGRLPSIAKYIAFAMRHVDYLRTGFSQNCRTRDTIGRAAAYRDTANQPAQPASKPPEVLFTRLMTFGVRTALRTFEAAAR